MNKMSLNIILCLSFLLPAARLNKEAETQEDRSPLTCNFTP